MHMHTPAHDTHAPSRGPEHPCAPVPGGGPGEAAGGASAASATAAASGPAAPAAAATTAAVAAAAAAAASASAADAEDCAARLVAVLALERFVDYSGQRAVAPVAAVCAQALSLVVRLHARREWDMDAGGDTGAGPDPGAGGGAASASPPTRPGCSPQRDTC
jgi:hypothetical protein